MKPEDFDYYLPPELIAQEPPPRRTDSRMMVLDRASGEIFHRSFTHLREYLRQGDLLIFNDTRVIPARLLGRKAGTGGRVEALLLHPTGSGRWEAMVQPGRRIKPGHVLEFGDGSLRATVVESTDDGHRILQFETDSFWEDIHRVGVTPLPPYIHRDLEDPRRYQTVFARHRGSSAAPTAALHFDLSILEKLKNLGIRQAHVTLHIGPGTFQPVKALKLEDHVMHREYYRIPPETLEIIKKTKKEGGRVIPVGTTSTRVMETVFGDGDNPGPLEGWTGIFIYPGYRFKVADALITNFHLPRSTLIMMISAFAGREFVLKAYREAVKNQYRFFSFGDCMLIV